VLEIAPAAELLVSSRCPRKKYLRAAAATVDRAVCISHSLQLCAKRPSAIHHHQAKS
jgi:hypothetical protein